MKAIFKLGIRQLQELKKRKRSRIYMTEKKLFHTYIYYKEDSDAE